MRIRHFCGEKVQRWTFWRGRSDYQTDRPPARLSDCQFVGLIRHIPVPSFMLTYVSKLAILTVDDICQEYGRRIEVKRMGRVTKARRVCAMPLYARFAPQPDEAKAPVRMEIEDYVSASASWITWA